MSNSNASFITCGFSDDILKVIKFYNSLPQISTTGKNCYLVYCEEYTQKESQVTRFNELTKMSIDQKKQVIEAANPEYLEITERMLTA